MPDRTPPTPPPSADAVDPTTIVGLAALVGQAGLTDAELEALRDALGDPVRAAELRALAEVVARLPETAPTTEVPVTTPPAELRDRVLATVRGDAATRRPAVSWFPTVAAAAVAVLVGVGLGRASVPTPPAVPVERLALDVGAFDVTRADLIAHTWGTELLFTFEGTTSGERYDVVVTAADGTVFAAGSFLGDGTRVVDCEMNVALLRGDAAAFTVTDADGEVVVAAELPPTGA